MPKNKRYINRRKIIECRKKYPIVESPINFPEAFDWLFRPRKEINNQ